MPPTSGLSIDTQSAARELLRLAKTNPNNKAKSQGKSTKLKRPLKRRESEDKMLGKKRSADEIDNQLPFKSATKGKKKSTPEKTSRQSAGRKGTGKKAKAL